MANYLTDITSLFNKSTECFTKFRNHPSNDLIEQIRIHHGEASIIYHKFINSIPQTTNIDNATAVKVSVCNQLICMIGKLIDECDRDLEGGPTGDSMTNSSGYGTTVFTDRQNEKSSYTPPVSDSEKSKVPVTIKGPNGSHTFFIDFASDKMLSEKDQLYKSIISELDKMKLTSQSRPRSSRPLPSQFGSKYNVTPSLMDTDNVFDASEPILLLIHGKSWCGGSKAFYDGNWQKVKQQNKTLELETDRNNNNDVNEITKLLHIKTVPALFYFDNGQVKVVKSRTPEGIASEVGS